jgi:hypothetical protein
MLLAPFRIFFFNEKIFGTERVPPVSISAAGVNDTDGQFVAGDIDNGGAT